MKPDMTYAGTAGHSGTDTSKAQAADLKRVGPVQRDVHREVARSGFVGRTVAELRREFPQYHHGQISSALTNLHRAGKIVRLVQQRNRAKLYVTPSHVDGRKTEPPRTKPTTTVCPHCGGDVPL